MTVTSAQTFSTTVAPGVIGFRVLGRVEAVRNGTSLPLGGPRQRALLALLLLHPGRALSTDRLVDELWHSEPPEGAATTLRSYVSRLRSVLGDQAPITGSAAGYALDVAREGVDAFRFEQLTREGEEARARGAARRASQLLDEALSLWRGSPFGELALDGSLQIEAERLEELRLHSLEEQFEADLALGRGPELVDRLEEAVQQHPYRERLWRQLMLALYRSERQADSLATYHRARRLLDEQLGLEPSPELQRLEQAILRRDVPDIVPPEEKHNLPAPLTSFVGREAELQQVGRLLVEARLVMLTGVGGATAVLHGWRPSTIDIDIRLETDADDILRAVAALKEGSFPSRLERTLAEAQP